MKKKIKEALEHPLIYGSSIVIIGNLIANFFNFIFNIFMLRNLTVTEYGVFASIMSLIVFPALVGNAIGPMVVRFAGDYFAKESISLLRGLYIKINKLLLVASIVTFFVFLLLIPTISSFFHLRDTNILLMTDVIIFFSLIGVINMAFLQAKLAFLFQVIVNFLNAIIKLALGVILVLFGYSVGGATFALLVAGIICYVVSFMPLRFIFQNKIQTPSISTKELFSYGLPSALTLLGLTSFISADIMLVKHFFDPHQAGLYAGLSLISRIIFYVSAPIGTVMFPVIVQKHSRKENFTNTFKLSLLLVLMPSIAMTILYSLFPNFFVVIFKTDYLSVASLLWIFSLFISLYCLLTILSTFYLSIQRTKIFIPIILGAILQIFLIYFFHQTFLQIIEISLIITFVLVCLLLLYYPYATKRKLHD